MCQQGVVTGCDAVFIRHVSDVSETDKSVWKPFLPDRLITRYSLPKKTDKVIFYPFTSKKRLSMEEVRNEFKDTWDYLESNYETLVDRAPVMRHNCEWWQPAWPRVPRDILGRARLVSPHLTISPRFGADLHAKFVVSRTIMIFAQGRAEEEDLLLYIVAMLNSSVGFWQLLTSSHKYRSGYAMLEKKTLDHVRIPSPTVIPRKLFKRILTLVRRRLEVVKNPDLDIEIDQTVSECYALSSDEKAAIGARRNAMPITLDHGGLAARRRIIQRLLRPLRE